MEVAWTTPAVQKQARYNQFDTSDRQNWHCHAVPIQSKGDYETNNENSEKFNKKATNYPGQYDNVWDGKKERKDTVFRQNA